MELFGEPDAVERFQWSFLLFALTFSVGLITAGRITDFSGPATPIVLACIVVAFVARIVYIAVRVPGLKRPVLTMNGENITVTDVWGARYHVAWSDITQISVTLVSSDDVHLRWTEAHDGDVDANMGGSISWDAWTDALSLQAPEWVEVRKDSM